MAEYTTHSIGADVPRESTASSRRSLGMIWGGQSFSILLSGATTIALSLWVYETTGNAVDLALLVAVRLAISIYLSPLAGALADRAKRKTLIVGSNLALSLSALAMLTLTTLPTQNSSVIAVCAILAISGALDSALLASLAASVRDVRREANLTQASSVISTLDSAPLVVAPMLGALLYQAMGIGPVLIADAASFVVAAVTVLSVRWTVDESSTTARGPSTLGPFRGAVSGLRMIWSHRDYSRLQIANACSNLANGLATTCVTVFLLTGMHGGPGVLGLYNSVAAAGLVVGSVVVGLTRKRIERSWAIGAGMLLAAVGGRILLGLSSAGPVGIVTGFARSIGIQFTNVPLTAIWMEATPRSEQGKVFGARRLLGQGAYPLAVILGGVIARELAVPGSPWTLSGWLVALGIAEALVAFTLVVTGVLRRVGGHTTPALTAGRQSELAS